MYSIIILYIIFVIEGLYRLRKIGKLTLSDYFYTTTIYGFVMAVITRVVIALILGVISKDRIPFECMFEWGF